MMIAPAQIIGIIAAIASIALVIELLRRRAIRERHALWWLTAGVLATLVGIFPSILTSIADLVGVDVPINLVFFICVAVLFFVSIQNSAELTSSEEKSRALAEEVALLRLRIQKIEEQEPR